MGKRKIPITTVDIEIGRRVREARKAAGYGCKQLAYELGLNPSMVCVLESGRVQMTISRLKKICDFLGVDISHMVSRLESPREKSSG